MDKLKHLVDKLHDTHTLTKSEFVTLINNRSDEISTYLFEKSSQVSKRVYGNKIFMRGLIEFTNFCKNDCYYCGIRAGNKNCERYRLSKEQILDTAQKGYDLGFRSFVLQGGEDNFYTDEIIIDIVHEIKSRHNDCAVTLSIGEKPHESYLSYYNAGADRFLLRHETADSTHYSKLHPDKMSAENRYKCLYDLKKIGYQVGCGFMVGSPFQTAENLADDMIFMKELNPQMIGIGPFLPHKDTPFKDEKSGTEELTLFMTALTRLMLPNALIPATTALETVSKGGREKGILAGANVIMMNISPPSERGKYSLYDNKFTQNTSEEEYLSHLDDMLKKLGYQISMTRGDYIL